MDTAVMFREEMLNEKPVEQDMIAQITAPIQKQMALVESQLQSIPSGQHDLVTAGAARLFRAGGKRVRPILCLLTGGLFDASPKHSVSLAAAVEMLHTATLVHDDLIDHSELRRGVATLNADWSPAATVLMGDYLFARAAKLVARTNDVRVMDMFAETLMIILNGEVVQQLSRGESSRAAYFERIYAKTAAMFVLSTQAAAQLGDADDASLERLEVFGRSVGMAYQIVDDVLDFAGTAQRIGKPVGSDLRQGLYTLPAIIYAETHASDAAVRALRDGGHRDADSVEAVVAAVRDSGALEATLREARVFAAHARDAIEGLGDSVYVKALSHLAEYIVHRDL